MNSKSKKGLIEVSSSGRASIKASILDTIILTVGHSPCLTFVVGEEEIEILSHTHTFLLSLLDTDRQIDTTRPDYKKTCKTETNRDCPSLFVLGYARASKKKEGLLWCYLFGFLFRLGLELGKFYFEDSFSYVC